MPTLLTLPTELRRQILSDALQIPADPPKNPSVTQDRERVIHAIWAEIATPSNNALPLLLTSRLINVEVNDLLSRSIQAKNCSIDVMWVKKAGMWPTWTSPPPPKTRHIDTLTATFRIFNPPDDLDSKFEGSLVFYYGCGGRGGVWTPYLLLKRFLIHGASLREKNTEDDKDSLWTPQYSIKNMIIDVLAPPEDQDHSVVGPGIRMRNGVGPDQEGEFFASEKLFTEEKWPKTWNKPAKIDPRTIPAEKLAHFISRELRELLRLSYYTMDYGLFLYEGIMNAIEIRVNGELRRKFDMQELFEMERTYFGETPDLIVERKRQFAVWKDWLLERKKLCQEGKPLTGRFINRPDKEIMEKW